MKKPLFTSLVVFILFIWACGNDEPERIKPIAGFDQDKRVVEVNDVITFSNISVDAVSFEWDFGDGNSSTLANPTHSYTEIGTYPVRLTVTSATGDKVASSSTIRVGRRFAVIFLIRDIEFERQDGVPWDADSSDPDLIFSYGPTSGVTDPIVINMGLDFQESELPFGDIFNPFQTQFLTNEEWTISLRENDEPYTDLSISEPMVEFKINPVTVASNLDNIEGQGSIELREGRYFIEIFFLIQ